MTQRTLRLFLSSTFRDLGEESDFRVKRVFLALRAKLKDRFVELVDVDLPLGADSCDAAQAYRFDAARDSWMMPPTVTR